MSIFKRLLASAALTLLIQNILLAQSAWTCQPLPIHTRWTSLVDPANTLPEYPRPQMVRNQFTSLNGLWDYAITPKPAADPVAKPTPATTSAEPFPTTWDGKILVPFPLESALSGVKKPLLPTQLLWYKRIFSQPAPGKDEKVLLHFGAVDWKTTVFLNGKPVGTHTGGYTAFTLDITSALKQGDNELVVKVFDPTDQGVGPHGKQVLHPQNIYYTATSGIWQTVWLETVPATYISDIQLTPDIDNNLLTVTVDAPAGSGVELIAMADGAAISKATGKAGTPSRLSIPQPHLWSPSDPYLYDLQISLVKGKGSPDRIKSYFGMRKISIAKDGKGVSRIFLNNHPYYNLGTLDQGFWPDGIYTAPTDEALSFDIRAIKAMGFNTIRKHIKVEPARWYYYADKLGMLVWQDMVNPNQGLPEGAKSEFEKESAEIVHQLHNNPSITTWVLFNEKWGQYDQERLTRWLKTTDPSRIVNGHTGEILYVNEVLRSPSPNAYVGADMTDVHAYPDPMISIDQPGKARVLGEFGGIGVFIPDHQWITGSAWGYVQEKPASLQAKYTVMNQHLELLQREGLSASIYTQPFDVEGEQNGLITYDREVVKIPFDTLRRIHAALNPDMGPMPAVTAQNADLTEPGILYSRLLQQYIDGNRDARFLQKLSVMAVQAGDKQGAAMAAGAYIATLQEPYKEEDLRFIAQSTRSTKDPGFLFIKDHPDAFGKALGQRPFTVTMMNLIYRGELEPLITAGADHPDWTAIEARAKQYGAPGEEIMLRAETVHFINHQDWARYVPAARSYLEKYGQNLSDSERSRFQQALDQHQ